MPTEMKYAQKYAKMSLFLFPILTPDTKRSNNLHIIADVSQESQ